MAVVFDLVREANAADDRGERAVAEDHAATVFELTTALGLPLFAAAAAVDPDAQALIDARDEARRNKDYAESDRLRDELVALGWTVEDTPGGTRVHK
jgi:cysteinyl-tRNA synthetase